MLEPVDDGETSIEFEAVETPIVEPEVTQAAAADQEPQVEVVDDHWGEQSVGPGDNSWNGEDDDRQQEFADASGRRFRNICCGSWRWRTCRPAPWASPVPSSMRSTMTAISWNRWRRSPTPLRPEIQAEVAEIEAVLERVQQLDPPGVAARSVSECIELQLRHLAVDTPGLTTAIAIARSHLELVAGAGNVPAAP